MKKAFALIVSLLLAGTLLAGCNSGAADPAPSASEPAASTAESAPASTPDEPSEPEAGGPSGTITFATNRTDMDDALAGIIAVFNEQYPDVTVEIEPIQDYTTAIKTRLASGDAPDVMYINGQITPTKDLYPQFFAPLDDMGYTKDSIYFYDMGVYEDSVYTLCEGVYVVGLLCDMSTLQSAGIEATPATYTELMDACAKLKDNGVTPIGSMLKTKWPLESWITVAFANETGNSNDFYESLTSVDEPFTPESPIGKMLEFVKGINDAGYFDEDMMSSDWDILRMDMSKTGFLLLANYGISALDGTDPANVAFFPLPIDDSGSPHTRMSSGWSMAVNKDCENMDAAKAFVKFWLEESTFQDDTGIIPSVKSRDSAVPQVQDFMAKNPVIFEDEGSTDAFNQITAAAQFGYADMIQEVLLGKTVEEVCADFNQKWATARATI